MAGEKWSLSFPQQIFSTQKLVKVSWNERLRENDANQGAGHVDYTLGNGAEFAQDPLSFPSGPITRLRVKRFKEALLGLIQEKWADSKKTKMGSNNNQGLVHIIKAIDRKSHV